MFYVKEKISSTAETKIEINDENVFCICPKCGREVQVNLEDVMIDGKGDLCSTAVLCEECSKKMIGDRYFTERLKEVEGSAKIKDRIWK